MFSPYFVFIRSSVFGADVGSEAIRVSYLTNGQQFETLGKDENSNSFPLTLTVIPKNEPVPDIINDDSVDDFDYVYSDEKKMIKYPNSTIRFASTLLGKIRNTELINLLQARKNYVSLSNISNNRLFAAGLPPEVVFSHAFTHIFNRIREKLPNERIGTFAISVPKFFTQTPRDSIRTTVKQAGFTPYIVDSTKALGIYYGQTYFNQIKKQNVLFINFGASNIELIVLKFSKTENKEMLVEELEYIFDDSLGGRDFDVLIADFIGKQFQYVITPKAEQIILKEAEKVKKLLTVNKHTNGYLELIDDEHDLSYTINATDLERLSQPLLQKFKNLTKQIKTKPDKTYLLGGTSRMPIIQDLVKNIYKIENVSTAFLQDEMMSQAATMFAASLNLQYRLKPIEYKSLEIYRTELFDLKKIEPIDTSLHLDYRRNYYVQINSSHYPTGSSIYTIYTMAGRNTSLYQTKDGLWRFRKPIGKVVRPWRTKLLGIFPKMMQIETDKANINEAVNYMYNLILEANQTLKNDYLKYSSDNERLKIQKAVFAVNKWMHSQKKFTNETLQAKITYLEDSCAEVFHRIQNEELLQAKIDNLTRVINYTHKEMLNAKDRSHKIPRKEFRLIIEEIEETKLWLSEKMRLQRYIKPNQNPVLTWVAVENKSMKILKMIKKVLKHSLPYIDDPVKQGLVNVKNGKVNYRK